MLAMLSLLAAASAATRPLSVEASVSATLERSPAVAEAEAEVQRADGVRRAQCGLRFDPTVQASAALVGEAWSVQASQPLSLTGEGRAACASARQTSVATRARLIRQRLEVAASARRAWVDAVAASARAELAAHALEVAVDIERAARRRHEVGEASKLDLQLAVLTVEQARSAWIAAAIAEGDRLQALAPATGVRLDALVLPSDPLAGAPAEDVTASGASPRSDLAAARAEVDAARSALGRARAATLAPVAVGAFVEEEGPDLRAGPTVSVTLPLWRANTDGRAGAVADLAAAEARADATARQVGAEQAAAHRTLAAVDAAILDQPADLAEQARAALHSVELGFDRGELDLLRASLLQARILEGHAAWIEGRRLVALARIDAALSAENAALQGTPSTPPPL